MQTQPNKSFRTRVFFLLVLISIQLIASAQLQWYQNQDGHNQSPNGTVATAITSLTPTSFLACYLWHSDNDQYTWKISKSHINGVEQKSFFKTGTTAMIEFKKGNKNSVYVLERNYPLGQNTEYTLYKLDTNLVIRAQKAVLFPNSFNIFNLNAFEVDGQDNIYLAGDGQYPAGYGFSPASFVLKADRNLVIKWTKMDSTQTSFTRLHIDHSGNVLVLADFYTFFPDIHLTKLSSNGQYINTKTIKTEPGRFSLYSLLADDDDLLLYGGKSVDAEQAVYLYRISHRTGLAVYKKTYFKSPGSQLNDLKADGNGNIFSLVTQYLAPGNQVSRISRINPSTGNLSWNRSYSFSQDSCNLSKLVVEEDDLFYAIGEQRSHGDFSRGFAMRMKKNGQPEGNYEAPDSVAFQRVHSLVDGIMDRNNQLIAIGNTNDLDTINYASSYFRSFAVRLGGSSRNICVGNNFVNNAELAWDAPPVADAEIAAPNNKLTIYPNPVQSQLFVSNLSADGYDRIVIYDMRGNAVQQRLVSGNTERMDVRVLSNGIYLLVLHSSVSNKEQRIKFVVSK